jgi:hypothetical protein
VSLPILFDHAPKHMREQLLALKWPPMVCLSCVMTPFAGIGFMADRVDAVHRSPAGWLIG